MDSITVAVARAGRGAPELYGDIPATPEAVRKLARRLDDGRSQLRFCYEAGPCGYGLYRQLTDLGYECTVVAPSMTPRRPGERIKTDRRDALTLAQHHRAGALTAVWVPDEEQEAIRDLVRCRQDFFKHSQRRTRQRLNAFLLRQGRVYPGLSRWTKTHLRWLERQSFGHPAQQIVFQEYVDAVQEATRRVQALEQDLGEALEGWSLAPVVAGLMALRGVDRVVAMTVVAELGDLTRFESPTPLMAYVGEVPSEHSSGRGRRQGGITKGGNSHVRHALTQAAWCYRFPARKTRHLQRRAEHTSEAVQAIAWKAQKRLCARYRHLTARNKHQGKVVTAVARELLGFMWAIACETMPRKAA